ncbi:MAG: IS1096 element passenger TnpR family protein [Flavobacteriaceae bacterium]
MIYRLRIILDSEEDVIRDIEIKSDSSFEDLHFAVINSFNFIGNEMASFYLSDINWSQGEEITLESFTDEKIMKNTNLDSIISDTQLNFIYVYDFLKLWTFFIEIIETCDDNKNSIYPQTIFSIGMIPKNAPEKRFEEDKVGGDNIDYYEDEDLNNYY